MNNPVIIGDATLYCGDCMDILPLVADGSVDMILADLPYGTTECAWDFVIPMGPLWEQYKRVLKPTGAVLLTAAQPFTSLLVASNLSWYRSEWIWEKGNATGFLNAKKQPLRAHESVLAFYKKQPTYNPQMSHGHKRETTKRRAVNSECYGRAFGLTEYDSTSRYPRSVQFFSSDKQIASLHPTQKPVALMEYMVRTYTNAGETVLDNTMGSGTTGVACANAGRSFIGMERDPVHFQTACDRLSAPLIPIELLQAVAAKQEQEVLL